VIVESEKKTYFSTYPPLTLIHLSHRFTGVSKHAAQKSFEYYLSRFRTSVSSSSSSSKFCHVSLPSYESLCTTYTSTVNTKHFFNNILLPKKRTTERYSSVVYSSSTVAILTIETCARAFAIWTSEADLCCYLVIHVESLLLPLQLFYFRLWPIY
jgi:hypothetical protein